MSFGQGDPPDESWGAILPDFFCVNCGCQVLYPYKTRFIEKPKSSKKDWKIIKSKIYIQTGYAGRYIRLCDCCDEFFITRQLIKMFLTMGGEAREKEKDKKSAKRERRIERGKEYHKLKEEIEKEAEELEYKKWRKERVKGLKKEFEKKTK